MKVRVLTAMWPTYPAGSEIELPDDQAQAWIGAGRAEPIRVIPRQAPVETTMAEPQAERAVSQPRRGKGR